ncbi:unnamed protein product [Schistosoma margrebowiei]|uniref:Ig-like domain-containing protein n=1 Tax=Schistosoma margrebowiei TaxID=48269 RepID=A0AA85AIJ6_9TREM|nr:unnamed protein product [Schistosoma margrebowiei]
MNQLFDILMKQILILPQLTLLLSLLISLLLIQISVASNSESKHYLLIHGPMHTNVQINSTVLLRCRVQLQIQNDLKENHYKVFQNSKLSSEAYFSEVSSSSSSTVPGTVWQVINPYLLSDKLEIIVQWMKDGFGYDQDTLRQTFNGRYTLVESEEKDVYDLMIKNIRFEDEGEYACQARLIKKTNSQYRPYYLYQFVNQSKFYQKSIKSNITNHFDSSIDDLFHLPMSLIKSNTAYLNVIVPPKSINLNILLYENEKYRFFYNNNNQLNDPVQNNQLNNQSIWIHLNQTIQFICSTSSWSKPLGRLLWYINDRILYQIKNEKITNYDVTNSSSSSSSTSTSSTSSSSSSSSSCQHINDCFQKRKELFTWLNMEFCNLQYGCHIINKTHNSMVIDHFSYTGQLIEFIQINDMPSGIQLFKTWSILSLNFHGTQMNQIPIMCSLENQHDYILGNNNNNANIIQSNKISNLGDTSLRSNMITIHLLYIDKVYIEIYSDLKTMYTSSTEHSMILIENRPIQLGCFCEKINVPIHANYEYT